MATEFSSDPEEEANVEAVLADPEIRTVLAEMDEAERQGKLVTYTDAERAEDAAAMQRPGVVYQDAEAFKSALRKARQR